MQKTLRRHGVTLEHGAFELRETVHVCKAGCRYPSGVAAMRRSQALAQLIPCGGVFGYDVIVYVGLQRFVYHRQRDEIRAALKNEAGLSLSSGEISTLYVRFADYMEALHEARSESIGEALASDGGWPLPYRRHRRRRSGDLARGPGGMASLGPGLVEDPHRARGDYPAPLALCSRALRCSACHHARSGPGHDPGSR